LSTTNANATTTLAGGLNVAGVSGLTVLQNGNVGIGTTSPVYAFDVVGYINTDSNSGYKQTGDTILRATPSLYDSTFVGRFAGNPTSETGSPPDNLFNPGTTAIGFKALASNVVSMTSDSGKYNTAVGYKALNLNTTGDHSTAVGWRALAMNTIGTANTGLGEDALQANTSGVANTSVGTHNLQDNTSGHSNSSVGSMALANNTTGFWNTAIGESTGISNFGGIGTVTTDNGLTFIGALASVDKSVNVGPFVNSTAVGFGSKVNQSNQIVLGNANVTQTLLKGNVGIGTTTPGAKLSVTGNGTTTGLTFNVTDSSNISKFVVLDNGNVGIGTTNPKGPLQVGNQVDTLSDDPQVLISRLVNNTGSGNAHGFVDTSMITRTNGGPIGYNSFDAYAGIGGSGLTFDHYVAFQARPKFGNTGTTGNAYGLAFIPTVSYGTVTNMYGVSVSDWSNPFVSGHVGTNYGVYVANLTNATNNYAIYADGATKSYFGGKVGIGTSSPAYTLHVEKAAAGTIAYFKAGANTCSLDPANVGGLSCSSDERLKTNIQTLASSSVSSNTLDKLIALRPVTYNWKTDPQGSTSAKYTGFIAQEVLPLFPDLVSTDNGGNYQLSYSGFIPYIVGAIQDLNNKIVSAVTGIFEKVQTKQLCLEDVCVTKTELRALLDKNGVAPQVANPVPPPNLIATSSDETSTTTDTTTDQITEPEATTTPPVVTPPTPTEEVPPPPVVPDETLTTPDPSNI
jgi:hypothetical protein